MTELVFTRPGKDDKGYFRRQLEYLECIEALGIDLNAANLNRYIDWLLQFCTEPKDRKAARRLLLDLSENELGDIGKAVTAPDPTPAPAEPSETS